MEKAILVGVDTGVDESFEYSMEELYNLAGACDIEVIDKVVQNLENINNVTYIGPGKAKEIADMVTATNADAVIFNDELSHLNIRNLEDIIPCKIIDRTMLILNIFSERAKTKEAKLQVEIAQLQYMLPRLIGLRESLGRQSGGGGKGASNKGLGEKKLELDRRTIERKISLLNKELEKLVLQRQTQRKKRKKNEIPVVAIVGYTNAGKSTLLNSMIDIYSNEDDKKVLEKDMLFATLQTSARYIKTSNNKELLFTDTVGFISKLPTFLIKAFRSTLEEVKEADLLVHVVDFANPNYRKQIEITRKVLKEIGVADIEELLVYNKIDLIDIKRRIKENDVLYISAKGENDVKNLVDEVGNRIFKDMKKYSLLIPYDKTSIEAYLREKGNMVGTEYSEEGIKLIVECRQKDIFEYQEYVMKEEKI